MNFLLIGRSNVGKSSIYNILTGFNSNIIHADSGTTRDWHEDIFKKIPELLIFDSPGLLLNNKKKKIVSNNINF